MTNEEQSTKEELMMEKLEEKAIKESETVDFTIYDVPVELKNKCISLAKLHHDNQVWKVLAEAMDALLEEKTSRVDSLDERVNKLEAQINTMKAMQEYSDEQRNTVTDGQPTFGEMREIDTSEDLEKLKKLSQRGDTQNDE